MTYFCSIGNQILYIFETHGIRQTPSSLERYLVVISDANFTQVQMFMFSSHLIEMMIAEVCGKVEVPLVPSMAWS